MSDVLGSALVCSADERLREAVTRAGYRATPAPTAGASQARMMQTAMPVMMTLIFYAFPSGLVLYYLTSNLLAVGHQLWVRHRLRAT